MLRLFVESFLVPMDIIIAFVIISKQLGFDTIFCDRCQHRILYIGDAYRSDLVPIY
jgi:hypothetical protein